MSSTMARRFAEVSLQLHAHEGSFELGLYDEGDLVEVARAFASMGYAPEVDSKRYRVRIDVASILLRSAVLA